MSSGCAARLTCRPKRPRKEPPQWRRDRPERRAAHERLSTGGLARWTRACATHPWRVVLGWVGIIAVLIALVATVGGSLKDEFDIPGSDTQKATDLIESEFAVRAGRRAEPRLRCACRRAARHARAQGRRSRTRSRSSRRDEFKPTEDKAGIESVGDPFDENTFSDDGRIAYAEAQFDRVIFDKDREAVVAVQDAVRETVEPAGVTVEFNGDAEFPPIEQGHAGAARPARGADRAARRLPHLRGDVDPDRARADGAGDRVPPALHPRRPDRHQHDHAAARVDDRPRRRDRLLAVHRHPLQTAPARRAVPGRRRRRGRVPPRAAPCSSPA